MEFVGGQAFHKIQHKLSMLWTFQIGESGLGGGYCFRRQFKKGYENQCSIYGRFRKSTEIHELVSHLGRRETTVLKQVLDFDLIFSESNKICLSRIFHQSLILAYRTNVGKSRVKIRASCALKVRIQSEKLPC